MENAEKRQYFALKGQVKEEPNDFNIQSNYILACRVTNWFGYIYTMNMFFEG